MKSLSKLVRPAAAIGFVVLLSCVGSQSLPATPERATPPPQSVQRLDGVVSLSEGFAPVVDRAKPAVVNISSTRVVKTSVFEWQGDPFFAPFFRGFGRDSGGGQGPGNQQERREKGLGSGVVVTADGYILTNNHVIQDADEVTVSLADERSFKAKVVGTDEKTDLALLKIEANNLPVLPLGDSTRVRVGEFALAIGNPFGLDQTVTLGIISAIGRGSIGIVDYEDFIQTDAAINPGNSGGALINHRGELIGINTAILSRAQGNQGIGFTIPAHLAKSVMDQLRDHGKVVRGYLGVGIQEITQAMGKALSLSSTKGALIGDVMAGTPADKAGIKRGDIVVAINGEEVASSTGFRMRISQTAPGTKVRLTVQRDSARRDVEVTLGELPDDGGLASSSSGSKSKPQALGLELEALNPALARRLGLPSGATGAVVTGVAPGSPAAEAGLHPGDVIQEVNRKPVADPGDVEKALAQANGKTTGKTTERPSVLLLVRRGDATRYVAL
ncbi:MAG: DegQ family serine endoprotease [Pseudomonadota bacterium]